MFDSQPELPVLKLYREPVKPKTVDEVTREYEKEIALLKANKNCLFNDLYNTQKQLKELKLENEQLKDKANKLEKHNKDLTVELNCVRTEVYSLKYQVKNSNITVDPKPPVDYYKHTKDRIGNVVDKKDPFTQLLLDFDVEKQRLVFKAKVDQLVGFGISTAEAERIIMEQDISNKFRNIRENRVNKITQSHIRSGDHSRQLRQNELKGEPDSVTFLKKP